MAIELRDATAGDAPALATLLGRAFSNDPPFAWVFRDPATRAERLAALFATAVDELFLPHARVLTTTDVAGVAVWDRPGEWRTPDDISARMAPAMAGAFLPDELDRLLTYLGLMDDQHPDEPEHWYLAVLAADLDRQGQGIGSACLTPVLRELDAGGQPAYLESSNERNVPLYERHGFRTVGIIDLPDGGPPVFRMWREPVGR